MRTRNHSPVLAAILLGLVASMPAAAQQGSSGSIKLDSGPHAGKYNFAADETCVIAAFGKKPLGLAIVLSSRDSSLSIDMPNIDEKHANELQIVLVVADKRAGTSGKATASTTYEVDTRPDAILEPFQKAERAGKGVTGKVTAKLLERGNIAQLTFSGETATGVKLEGAVDCRRVSSEPAQ